jgi:hypothetical protein
MMVCANNYNFVVFLFCFVFFWLIQVYLFFSLSLSHYRGLQFAKLKMLDSFLILICW